MDQIVKLWEKMSLSYLKYFWYYFIERCTIWRAVHFRCTWRQTAEQQYRIHQEQNTISCNRCRYRDNKHRALRTDLLLIQLDVMAMMYHELPRISRKISSDTKLVPDEHHPSYTKIRDQIFSKKCKMYRRYRQTF